MSRMKASGLHRQTIETQTSPVFIPALVTSPDKVGLAPAGSLIRLAVPFFEELGLTRPVVTAMAIANSWHLGVTVGRTCIENGRTGGLG